jgi:hypothetical protein
VRVTVSALGRQSVMNLTDTISAPPHTDGMSQTAEYWRQRAEEARARAEAMHDPECKQIMLDIAKAYESLANHDGKSVDPKCLKRSHESNTSTARRHQLDMQTSLLTIAKAIRCYLEEMRLLRQKITRTSQPGGRKRHRRAVHHGASPLLGRSAGSSEEFRVVSPTWPVSALSASARNGRQTV